METIIIDDANIIEENNGKKDDKKTLSKEAKDKAKAVAGAAAFGAAAMGASAMMNTADETPVEILPETEEQPENETEAPSAMHRAEGKTAANAADDANIVEVIEIDESEVDDENVIEIVADEDETLDPEVIQEEPARVGNEKDVVVAEPTNEVTQPETDDNDVICGMPNVDVQHEIEPHADHIIDTPADDAIDTTEMI